MLKKYINKWALKMNFFTSCNNQKTIQPNTHTKWQDSENSAFDSVLNLYMESEKQLAIMSMKKFREVNLVYPAVKQVYLWLGDTLLSV